MRHPPTPSRCSPRRCRWFCLVLCVWNTVALVPHEERPRGDVSVDGDQDLSDTSVPREEEDEEPQALGEEHTEEDAGLPDKHAEMDSPNAKARDVAIAADGSSSSSSSSSTSSTARARDEDEQEIVPDRSSSNNMLLRRARDRGLGSPVDAGGAASPSAQSTAATREIDNLDGGREPIISGVDQHRTKKSDRPTKRAGAAPAAEAPRGPSPTVALTAGRFEKTTATVVLHPDDDLMRDQASDTPWTTLSASASSTSSAATSEHENGSSASPRTFSAALFQSVLTVVSGTGLERDPHKTLPSSDLEHTLRQRLNLQDSLVLAVLLGFYWGTLLLGAQLVYRLSCNKSSIRYYNNALFDGTMKDRDAADVPDHVEGQHRRWTASLWSACGDLWAAAVGVLPSASGRGQMGAGRSESSGSGGCEIDVGAGTRRTTTSGAGAATTGAAPASSEVAAEGPGRNSMELLFCDSTDTEAFVGCFLAPPEHVQLRVRGWRRESIQVAQSWGMLQPLLGQSGWDVVFGPRYGLVPAFDIALDVHGLCEADRGEGPSEAFVAAPAAEVSHCTTTTCVHDQKQNEGPPAQRQSEASPASSTINCGSTLQLQVEVQEQVASSTSAAAASSSTTSTLAAHQSPAASEDAPRAPAPPSTTTHQAPVQIAKPAPLAAEKIRSSPELQRHVITHFIRRTTKDNPLEVLRIEKHTAWPAFPQVARKIRTFLSSPEVQFPGVVSISYSAVDVVHVQSNEGWANFLRNQTTFWLMMASGVGLLWYLPYLQCKNIVTKTRARYKISKSAEDYWNCLQSDLGSVFATAIAAGGAASAPVAAGGAGPPGPG